MIVLKTGTSGGPDSEQKKRLTGTRHIDVLCSGNSTAVVTLLYDIFNGTFASTVHESEDTTFCEIHRR
jgi:hypothetical protein